MDPTSGIVNAVVQFISSVTEQEAPSITRDSDVKLLKVCRDSELDSTHSVV